MIIYKKHTGKKCIVYNEAVEEALCFGWIDGKIKRVNEEYYIQRYTPRNPRSRWSAYNIERVRRMIRMNRMTQAGMEAYNEIFKNPGLVYENRFSGEIIVPGDLLEALKINKSACTNFNRFPPSSKRMYIGWLNSAKMAETRKSRILKIVKACEINKRPGMTI
jgi:uncharacterized protein YdeI (YjbR/CyaY-like superfamily)